MLISRLIEKLQEQLEEHGDIKIYAAGCQDDFGVELTEDDIEIVPHDMIINGTTRTQLYFWW